MFQFPHFPSTPYGGMNLLTQERVPPFGYLRVNLLNGKPELFAVWPRPSSALDAKASTVGP